MSLPDDAANAASAGPDGCRVLEGDRQDEGGRE